MDNIESIDSMNNTKKKTILIAIIAAVLLLTACLITYLTLTSTSRKLTRQLEIANEYMENGDYEKAIAAFTEAIEIDPTSTEAYLGAAEAYVALDDYESAVEILQKGYDVTGSDEIKAKLDEYTAVIEARRAEEARLAEEESKPDNMPETTNKQVVLDFTYDDFKFMGHSVSEAMTASEIASVEGIPNFDEILNHTNVKYSWTSDDVYMTIYCPSVVDGGEWDGNGGLYGYSSGPEYVEIYVCDEHRFIDEFYEGPINIGDSKEKVNEIIKYDELTKEGSYSEDGERWNYDVESPQGLFLFTEYVFSYDQGYYYELLFSNGSTYGVQIKFSTEGYVQSIAVYNGF